ncbi:MAG: hypothetical protein JRJ43_11860, partial [Deltaproteobacteria bacterium]|nr:hypothetical protein [Deltaproteobacteria bacterium]
RWEKLGYEPATVPFLEDDISFNVLVGGQSSGVIGKVTSSILDRLDIKQPVYVAEIGVEQLLQRSHPLIEFTPLPLYPAAPRDIAIVVDENVRADELVGAVKKSAGYLAESVKIFDLYMGKQIEKGRKSIAIAITYRSQKGSLSSEQVDDLQQKVVDYLKEMFNAEVRDK